jgi:hypothetical protein
MYEKNIRDTMIYYSTKPKTYSSYTHYSYQNYLQKIIKPLVWKVGLSAQTTMTAVLSTSHPDRQGHIVTCDCER